jgi:hypothetical protein
MPGGSRKRHCVNQVQSSPCKEPGRRRLGPFAHACLNAKRMGRPSVPNRSLGSRRPSASGQFQSIAGAGTDGEVAPIPAHPNESDRRTHSVYDALLKNQNFGTAERRRAGQGGSSEGGSCEGVPDDFARHRIGPLWRSQHRARRSGPILDVSPKPTKLFRFARHDSTFSFRMPGRSSLDHFSAATLSG